MSVERLSMVTAATMSESVIAVTSQGEKREDRPSRVHQLPGIDHRDQQHRDAGAGNPEADGRPEDEGQLHDSRRLDEHRANRRNRRQFSGVVEQADAEQAGHDDGGFDQPPRRLLPQPLPGANHRPDDPGRNRQLRQDVANSRNRHTCQ